jgi:hypothetical protein
MGQGDFRFAAMRQSGMTSMLSCEDIHLSEGKFSGGCVLRNRKILYVVCWAGDKKIE